jgi:MarR family transcriptional regulator, lower aerobic nicotinate degradation pathway regulator
MGTHTSGTQHFRSILDSIRRIVRALRVSSRHSEQSAGLSSAQLFVLQNLSASQSIGVNELAARTFTHQSTVSVVVQRLVNKKLIVRQRSRSDGRALQLKLSKSGAALVKRPPVQPAQHQLVHSLRALSKKDQAMLSNLLSALVHGAGWAGAPPHLFFEEPACAPRKRKRHARS